MEQYFQFRFAIESIMIIIFAIILVGMVIYEIIKAIVNKFKEVK